MLATIDNALSSTVYYLSNIQPSSAYVILVKPVEKYVWSINNRDIFDTKNISNDKNKPCYKTSVRNIHTFLDENDIYVKSSKKELIVDNLNRSFCGFGVSKDRSKQSMANKIKDSMLTYEQYDNQKKENLNNMNKIFFYVLNELNDKLS